MVTVYDSDYTIAKDRIKQSILAFADFSEATVEINEYWKNCITVSEETDGYIFTHHWCPVLIYSSHINCRDKKYLSVCKKLAKEFNIDSILMED
ncbi:unnamed protein product [marine sediment metagenome]|uniref:Uncharacterized protein n=1 Tax=marine sediment metagenome TaxID=412755 RepID=X1B2M7_9ZZZZ